MDMSAYRCPFLTARYQPKLGQLIATVLMALGFASASPAQSPTSLAAARSIQVTEGGRVSVWADEEQLANPVAIALDEVNRVYVAELHRVNRGVAGPPDLLDDQMSQTVEDRLRMYEKHANKRPEGMDWYRSHSDRIVRLEDSTGDGRADKSIIFADGFNAPLDGLGAGVLVRDNTVWYANIPNLWQLRDTSGDGRANDRTAIATGFGVRVGYLGHDLHGLAWGPDGRIYFSIGDRGFNVTNREGVQLAAPGRGAIFRCEPDGSQLEVFFHGLRNPQEIAFDDWGRLLTGDNNSDAGDRARVVYAMEGGDAGWEQSFQYIGGDYARGPWNAERIWHLADPDQPAWILPPIGHITSGPCGMTYDPGVGLPPRYRNHFFLVDYLYSPANTVVQAFKLQPEGAGFKLDGVHPFIRGVALTDLEFGHDGKLYLADFIEGGAGTGKGRIFTVDWPEELAKPEVAEVARLFKEGFSSLSTDVLVRLLGHSDQRVRLRAQFTLANRGESSAPHFARIALTGGSLHARVHALWGLGQLARKKPELLLPVARLVDARETELRTQYARVVGDARWTAPAQALVRRLSEESLPAPLAQVAIALGKMNVPTAIPALLDLLERNDNTDPFLRHAAVMGLAGQSTQALLDQLGHPSAAARLGLVVALRRQAVGPDGNPVNAAAISGLTRALSDPVAQIQLEAARAIHDLRLMEAHAALANQIDTYISGADKLSSMPPPDNRATNSFTVEYFGMPTSARLQDFRQLRLHNGPPAQTKETHILESERDRGDQYVTRIRGLLTAPQTGNYTFYISADDRAEVWLSADDSPFRSRRICQATSWTAPYAWETSAEQVSEPIQLEKDRRYRIEVLHIEGSGQDHVAVGWKRPDGVFERPVGSGENRGAGREDDPYFRRIVNAALRLGTPELAQRVAQAAFHSGLTPVQRTLAHDTLVHWPSPPALDRVMGYYDPRAARAISSVRPSLTRHVLEGLASLNLTSRSRATQIAEQFEIPTGEAHLLSQLRSNETPAPDRLAALRMLTRDPSSNTSELLLEASKDPDPRMRGETLGWWLRLDPDAARPHVVSSLSKPDDTIQTRAILDALLGIPSVTAAPLLFPLVQLFDLQQVPSEIQAEFLDAVEFHKAEPPLNLWWERFERNNSEASMPIAYSYALSGGDARRGADVFHNQPNAQCIRCHRINGLGAGMAGPDLSGIGKQYDRVQLLASIVDPNREFAPGHEAVELTLLDGSTLSGVVKSEEAETLVLEEGDEIGTGKPRLRTLSKSSIVNRIRGRSPMPEGYGEVLSRTDLRDLIEFLATNQSTP